jgi:uncharacterized protein YcbX
VSRVSRLFVAPVKGVALTSVDEIQLTLTGVPENRRFFLIDERGKLLNGTRDGPLFGVRAACDADGSMLRLVFPDGRVVEGAVALDELGVTPFWDRPVRGRPVIGPWSDALSDFLGQHVRVVRAEDPGGGTDTWPVSLVSEASVEKLADEAGTDSVDGRRFRMLVHVDGTSPHEEDTWIGRDVRLGGALVRVTKQDARCRMTTRNPDTGVRDFDTLRAIKDYRGVRNGKSIDFGVYAEVVEPGRVRVGDPVEPS